MALDMTITCIDDHVQGIVPIVYVLTFWIQKVMFTVVIARQANPRFNQTSIFSCLRSVFSVVNSENTGSCEKYIFQSVIKACKSARKPYKSLIITKNSQKIRYLF